MIELGVKMLLENNHREVDPGATSRVVVPPGVPNAGSEYTK